MNKQIYYAAEQIGGSATQTIDYIMMTDPETQAAIKVPKEFETFIGHVASANRKGGKRSAKEEIEKIQDEYEISKTELKELREKLKAGGDGSKQIENIKLEYEKMLKEKDNQIELMQKESGNIKSKFENLVVDTDLMRAMSECGLDFYNFQQSLELLKLQGQAKPKEIIDLTTGQGTGKHETILTLNIADQSGMNRPTELKPKEAIEKFFSLDVNKFHIKNKLNPGSGSIGSNYMGGISNDLKYQEAMKKGDLKSAIAIKQEQYNKSLEKR